MPYELVDRATNAAHVIPPRGAWLTIGREPPEENDVVRHEQEVSRRHAQLHEARDGVMLRVLSPNGVYKRGERGRIAMDPATGTEPEFLLYDGDQFSLLRPGKFDDDVAFFVRQVSAAAPTPAPPALVDLTGDDSPAADPTPSSRDAASEGAFAPPAPAPRRNPPAATNFDGSPRNSPVAPDADGSLLSAAAGDSLLGDIARFRKAEAADPERAAAAAADESSLLKKTIGTLGTILTYNFFIIIGFFTWFMTGVVAQFGFQQTALIDAFRGAWDYVIQPLLGTHMTLTFLSYGLEKVAAGDGEDEYTKYNR